MSFEEGELPVKLNKLEIAPVLPQIKFIDAQIPVSLNPFFGEKFFDGKITESEPISTVKSKAAHRGRYRFRRRSESYLDECKESSVTLVDNLEISHNHIRDTPRIYKQPLKKSPTPIVPKRFILREPVLRSFHTCLQTKCINRRSKQLTLLDEDKTTSKFKTPGMSSFRELLSECQHLIDHDVDTKSRLKPSKFNCVISKSFTSLQSNESKNCQLGKKDNNRKLISLDYINRSPNDLKAPKIRTSTTCSQQAGSSTSNSNNCDDVTINELACYFDTLVHIPKKMSSMAEMMYI